MNIERILGNFEEHYKKQWGIRSSPKEAKKLIKQYLAIPLTLPIEDKSTRRICEVLTRAGYQVTESCEGHLRGKPRIFLMCPSQYHLRHLTSILTGESREKNFPWNLRTYTGEVFINPDNPLLYRMEPNLEGIDSIDRKNYQEMIDDLDIIGISILRYFSSVDLTSLERDRKKIDASTRKFKIPCLPEDFFKK